MRNLQWTALGLMLALAGCPVEEPATPEAKGDLQSQIEAVEELSRVEGQLNESEIRYGELAAAWRDATGEALPADLAEEDEDYIRNLLADETQVTRRSLLERLLRSLRTMDDFRTQIEMLRAQLPVADIVRPGDTHLGLATNFLRVTGGLDDEAAEATARKTMLADSLLPGMEVWHFWSDGLYLSAVTQGSAPNSPWLVNRAEWNRLERQRDDARAEANRLGDEATELSAANESLRTDHAMLREEHDQLNSRHVAILSAWEAASRASREMRFGVRALRDLRRDEVVGVASRRLLHFPDSALTETQDPTIAPIVVVTAHEVGLPRLRELVLLPEGRFSPGIDYETKFAADGRSATLRVVRPDRFAGEELLIAAR